MKDSRNIYYMMEKSDQPSLLNNWSKCLVLENKLNFRSYHANFWPSAEGFRLDLLRWIDLLSRDLDTTVNIRNVENQVLTLATILSLFHAELLVQMDGMSSITEEPGEQGTVLLINWILRISWWIFTIPHQTVCMPAGIFYLKKTVSRDWDELKVV
jgi:hypothetical protein